MKIGLSSLLTRPKCHQIYWLDITFSGNVPYVVRVDSEEQMNAEPYIHIFVCVHRIINHLKLNFLQL